MTDSITPREAYENWARSLEYKPTSWEGWHQGIEWYKRTHPTTTTRPFLIESPDCACYFEQDAGVHLCATATNMNYAWDKACHFFDALHLWPEAKRFSPNQQVNEYQALLALIMHPAHTYHAPDGTLVSFIPQELAQELQALLTKHQQQHQQN